jgi:small subunit ribosomal protein S6
LNRYELIAIVKTELADEDITAIMDRSQTIITERNGVIAKIEKWGKRRLAYEINKQKDGFYIFIDFSGDGPMVAEIERNYKIDDRILKFMTVRKKGAVTREGIDEEFAAAQAKQTQIRIESDPSAIGKDEKPTGEVRVNRILPRKPITEEASPAPAKGE